MTETLYAARFPVGSAVAIVGARSLENFRRVWKYHHPLQSEQIPFAGRTSTVVKIGFYQGGDVLYELKDIPGDWHECCLVPATDERDSPIVVESEAVAQRGTPKARGAFVVRVSRRAAASAAVLTVIIVLLFCTFVDVDFRKARPIGPDNSPGLFVAMALMAYWAIFLDPRGRIDGALRSTPRTWIRGSLLLGGIALLFLRARLADENGPDRFDWGPLAGLLSVLLLMVGGSLRVGPRRPARRPFATLPHAEQT